MITQTYYISSGKKNAMYTLRVMRQGFGAGFAYMHDLYLCNLANDQQRAEEKAEEYVSRLRGRIEETADYKVHFDINADFSLFERRSVLSVADTCKIMDIENGVFPFGKHKGEQIADCPDSYALYFADMVKDESLNVVMAALCAACSGVALDRGLIAKREAVRAERASVDALSNHVGTVGERIVFTGTVFMAYHKTDTDYGTDYHINKVRCGGDIVTYIGNKLAEVGEVVVFKATIKAHDLYNGVKTTKVNRPAHQK